MGGIHPPATPFVVVLSSLVLAFRPVNKGITKTGWTFPAPKLCQNRAIKGANPVAPHYQLLNSNLYNNHRLREAVSCITTSKLHLSLSNDGFLPIPIFNRRFMPESQPTAQATPWTTNRSACERNYLQNNHQRQPIHYYAHKLLCKKIKQFYDAISYSWAYSLRHSEIGSALGSIQMSFRRVQRQDGDITEGTIGSAAGLHTVNWWWNSPWLQLTGFRHEGTSQYFKGRKHMTWVEMEISGPTGNLKLWRKQTNHAWNLRHQSTTLSRIKRAFR